MDEPKRTEFAMQAVDFAEMFQLVVGATQLTGPTNYSVELSAPEGPSTGGGTQAVQHMKLVPENGNSVLVIGSANQVEQTAKIRTFEHIAAQYRTRFKGAELPVDRDRYEQLLQAMESFFTQQGLAVTWDVIAPHTNLPAPAERASSGSLGPIVVLLLGLLAGAISYFALK